MQDEVPEFLMQKRAEDGILVFTKRVDQGDTVRDIMRDALGVVVSKTENGNFIFTESKDQLVNQVGARQIFHIIRGKLNSVVSLTQLDDDEIKNITDNFANSLSMYLWENYRAIGLPSSMILPLYENLLSLVYCQLKKSKGGMENKRVSVAEKEEIHTLRGGQEGTTFLQRIGRRAPEVQQ